MVRGVDIEGNVVERRGVRVKRRGPSLLGGAVRPLRRGEQMRVALGIAFAMVAVAPFFGRWRANVWLRKNMPAERTVESVPKTAEVTF